MKTFLAFLAITLILFTTGCLNTEPKDSLDLESVVIELRELESVYKNTVDSKDIDAILQFYNPDLVTVSPDSPILYGIDWIRTALMDIYASYEFEESFKFVDIKIIDDRAVASYTFIQQMILISSTEELIITGKGVCILKKSEKGIWQFEWNSYTNDNQEI